MNNKAKKAIKHMNLSVSPFDSRKEKLEEISKKMNNKTKLLLVGNNDELDAEVIVYEYLLADVLTTLSVQTNIKTTGDDAYVVVDSKGVIINSFEIEEIDSELFAKQIDKIKPTHNVMAYLEDTSVIEFTIEISGTPIRASFDDGKTVMDVEEVIDIPEGSDVELPKATVVVEGIKEQEEVIDEPVDEKEPEVKQITVDEAVENAKVPEPIVEEVEVPVKVSDAALDEMVLGGDFMGSMEVDGIKYGINLVTDAGKDTTIVENTVFKQVLNEIQPLSINMDTMDTSAEKTFDENIKPTEPLPQLASVEELTITIGTSIDAPSLSDLCEGGI